MRIRWKRAAQAAVLLLALAFLATFAAGQWASLAAYRWQLAPWWALLALAGFELAWLWEAATWNAILRGLTGGRGLALGRAARAWFLSNLVRYIPGNVWQFLGMVELAAEDGVPRPATLAAVILHQAISTSAGLTLAALYFAVTGAGRWLGSFRPFLLLVPLGLFLLQPRILEWLLNQGLRRLGRPLLVVTLRWRDIWLIVVRYVIAWCVEGLSFVALCRALAPFGWDTAPHLAASWVAAYLAGFLSLLTPSGLGVREGSMALLLAAILPAPLPALIPIASRLWLIVAELLAAGVVLLAGRSEAGVVKTRGLR